MLHYLHLSVYLYESAFHNDAAARTNLQTSMLVSCYEACKDCLEHFVKHNAEVLAYLTIVQWSLFLNTLILMVRLSRPLSSIKAWDATSVRSIAKVENYIDAFMRVITGSRNDDSSMAARPETLFLWLRLLGDGMKKWLTRGGIVLDNQYPSQPGEQVDVHVGSSAAGLSMTEAANTVTDPLNVDGMMEDVAFDDGFLGNFVWDWSGQPGATMGEFFNF